jgi:hypothetical protein
LQLSRQLLASCNFEGLIAEVVHGKSR